MLRFADDDDDDSWIVKKYQFLARLTSTSRDEAAYCVQARGTEKAKACASTALNNSTKTANFKTRSLIPWQHHA
jgi:hypothetical protein